jgi:hypothetical protein
MANEEHSGSFRQLDSLSANEFVVEIDGERVTGVFRVSGLTPFKLDVKPSLIKSVQEPFKIMKMVTRDAQSPFNLWLRATIDAREDIVRPTRTVTILGIDEGTETRRWIVSGAWIAEVNYSDFNTASSELVEETLVIHYDSIETHWLT